MAWPEPPGWRRYYPSPRDPLTDRAEVEECRRQLGQRPYAALEELWLLDPDDWVRALDGAD